MSFYKIINSDIIEWLKSYDGERFHSCISDPPYALISISKRFGKDNSTPTQEGSDGLFSRLSAGFMGQKWDSFADLDHYENWIAEWSNSMMRVLYPGAVCAFFGGTRTWHRLARGLERGGFEIVDCLMWLYGAGLPKSHDTSKAIDKAAGAERKVIGKKPNIHSRGKFKLHKGYCRPWMDQPGAAEKAMQLTAPATEAAKQWDGWGTALKPAWEPIILCRTPRGSVTFAELAKTYGTGALNIDGSRISGEMDQRTYGKGWKQNKAGIEVYEGSFDREGRHVNPSAMDGRWPANLLLSHHEDCVKVGEFEVKARIINRWKGGMKPFGEGAGGEYETIHPTRQGEPSADRTYEDEGGTNFAMKPGARRDNELETVERWACVPNCPIRALDDQAGMSKSPSSYTRKADGLNVNVFGEGMGEKAGKHSLNFGDSGGPSRFFYTGKANRNEKDGGCEHLFWDRRDGGMVLVSQKDWESLPKKERSKGNIHPTVKPLDLLRYIATLLKPPDAISSRLLVPFAGSGSEMIAGIESGWNHVTGIEIEPNYILISKSRLSYRLGMFSKEI